MFRLAVLGGCALMLMAFLSEPPRNFNDEYLAGNMLYGIAEELEGQTRGDSNFPRTSARARSLKNAAQNGIIEVVLDSGDNTRLHGRCAMIHYGGEAQQEYNFLVQVFATEYRNSRTSAYKKVYRWMVNRLREANDALQRGVNRRRGVDDCSSCMSGETFTGDC